MRTAGFPKSHIGVPVELFSFLKPPSVPRGLLRSTVSNVVRVHNQNHILPRSRNTGLKVCSQLIANPAMDDSCKDLVRAHVREGTSSDHGLHIGKEVGVIN